MFDWIKRLYSRNQQDEKPAAAEDRIRTVTCRSCGRPVSYDPSRERIPEYCPECKAKARAERGMITRTCKKCGKTFILPEEVQHWPDYCQECRKKYKIVEQITRKCRGCGKEFTFPSNVWHWPEVLVLVRGTISSVFTLLCSWTRRMRILLLERSSDKHA